MTKKLIFRFSSMYKRRISFKIILKSENHNIQESKKKTVTQFSKFTDQLHY